MGTISCLDFQEAWDLLAAALQELKDSGRAANLCVANRYGQVLAQASLLQELVDVPSPHAGVLEEIVVAAGEKFAPGTVLARVAAT